MRADHPLNKQQEETLNYFRNYAGDWQMKAEDEGPCKVNIVKQRNDYVLRIATAQPGIKRALDVGCGTGNLALDLTSRGIATVGIDFAAEMIEICRQHAAALGQRGIEFIEASIFEYTPQDSIFDLISANGFIEYISKTQLVAFLNQARSLLASEGSLVLGSRNRLFNVFSLSEYTRLEMERGNLQELTSEAMVFHQSATIKEVIEELRCRKNGLPPFESHPPTGVNVTTRYQYTPGQLIELLGEAGFECHDLHPIHFHAAAPRFAIEHADLHTTIANLMESYGSDCPYLIPFASSFMLHAIRR